MLCEMHATDVFKITQTGSDYGRYEWAHAWAHAQPIFGIGIGE